ncbi:hypothetical protein [Embleya scabrispora]|uniref:hypothetical protein n=1 Tax=Embleya scabrispora TaxID=159449 RepID=UPI000476416F|nr:hypothetical protein [Embleya scabrispora]MYS79591.1 hypothetical protein [Streptomyces sp. SID5474]
MTDIRTACLRPGPTAPAVGGFPACSSPGSRTRSGRRSMRAPLWSPSPGTASDTVRLFFPPVVLLGLFVVSLPLPAYSTDDGGWIVVEAFGEGGRLSMGVFVGLATTLTPRGCLPRTPECRHG